MHGWTLSRCFFQINVQYADFVHECVLCTPADNESASLKEHPMLQPAPRHRIMDRKRCFRPAQYFRPWTKRRRTDRTCRSAATAAN